MPASDKRNIAVIFAGGSGSRMNHPDGPKQFVKVKNKPVIIYTLERFEKHPDIDAIYIACIKEGMEQMRDLVDEYGITKVKAIVKGGDSAQESIFNGLVAAREDDANNEDTCVLIHDGVRPIINNKLINDNIASVHEKGSAISAIPAFETVARSFDGGDAVDFIDNRDLMYILQAPQSFRLYHVYDVNKRSQEEGMMGKFIDQAHMMNHYGHDIHMVDSFRGNVKITIPLDLAYFTFLIESGELEKIVGKEAA